MSEVDVNTESPCTVDELLAFRASEEFQPPVIAYPRSINGDLDFELLTARDLDGFTNLAIRKLLDCGLMQIVDEDPRTVALTGPSDLEFIITMFALSRLGYTVLILSPRLPPVAWRALLDAVSCSVICHSTSLKPKVHALQRLGDIRSIRMLSRGDFQSDSLSTKIPKFTVCADRAMATRKVAFIMHSSGSTGLPKPIFQTHQACLENYTMGHGMPALLTVPLYHTHGHASLYRAMYKRSSLYFLDANLPVTSSSLLMALEHVKPDVVLTVPYILAFMAESKRGLQALESCKIVSATGSPVPDELGNQLVSSGIHLVSIWGSTETGVLMNSMRDLADKDWAYLRILPSAKPFVFMKPLDNDTYELVALDGLKSKVISNSDDPPKSFYTKDIFRVHSTKPDRWKYIGRLDDRVTLLNGEKVLPIPIEGRLRQEELIREAVVFGVGRAFPGLLVFRSQIARDITEGEFIAGIWPAVQEVNSRSESFAEITKNMILIQGSDVEYPMTDKGNFIRPRIYKDYEEQINVAYEMLENETEGTSRLSQADMEAFIMRSFLDQCSIDLENAQTDFFSAGADSLQAAKMAAIIKKELYLGVGQKKVGPNTIFEQANSTRLAKHLIDLSNGHLSVEDDETERMNEMIERYSRFNQHIRSFDSDDSNHSVILTGATGSLGAHVLASILRRDDICKVYCLVRASSIEVAHHRVSTALRERGLSVIGEIGQRVIPVPAELRREDLGLQPQILLDMRNDVSSIIHIAWDVNFNLSLYSFEQHIRGTQNLLNFALSVKRPAPAKFMFCSSISVASQADPTSLVPETVITDMTLAGKMGYAQSKIVAENIVNRASLSAGIDCQILRIGQIVGDSKLGLWNESESIPLIIRSALTLGCLPMLEKSCSWLPVDAVAQAILELGFDSTGGPKHMNRTSHDCSFYNIVNPCHFSWTDDLLLALRANGLSFETVSTQEWLARLEKGDQDPERNPTVKLLSLYKRTYGKDSSEENRELKSGDGEVKTRYRYQDVDFATEETQKQSKTIKNAPDIIQENYVEKFVRSWLRQWEKKSDSWFSAQAGAFSSSYAI